MKSVPSHRLLLAAMLLFPALPPSLQVLHCLNVWCFLRQRVRLTACATAAEAPCALSNSKRGTWEEACCGIAAAFCSLLKLSAAVAAVTSKLVFAATANRNPGRSEAALPHEVAASTAVVPGSAAAAVASTGLSAKTPVVTEAQPAAA